MNRINVAALFQKWYRMTRVFCKLSSVSPTTFNTIWTYKNCHTHLPTPNYHIRFCFHTYRRKCNTQKELRNCRYVTYCALEQTALGLH